MRAGRALALILAAPVVIHIRPPIGRRIRRRGLRIHRQGGRLMDRTRASTCDDLNVICSKLHLGRREWYLLGHRIRWHCRSAAVGRRKWHLLGHGSHVLCRNAHP